MKIMVLGDTHGNLRHTQQMLVLAGNAKIATVR